MITVLTNRTLKKYYSLAEKVKTPSSKKFYFGYGANLDPAFFKSRIKSSRHLGLAILPDHKFCFNVPCEYKQKGYGGIIECEGSSVFGSLYEVSDVALELLDTLEWVQFSFYHRKSFEVIINGEKVAALAYVPVFPRPNLIPSKSYKELIVRAAEKMSCPTAYINELKNYPEGSHFLLDYEFNLSCPGRKRPLPWQFYILHDKLREKLCELI